MSYLVSQAISDIRGEFEGGKSLSLDFYSLLRRGANNVLDNINPETLKRRAPIYGGVANNLAIYYCPVDVEVPSAIYRQPNDPTPVAKYVPPMQFYMKNEDDTFTIEYINGVRFLIFRKSIAYNFTVVDTMDDVGTKVSDQTLRVNKFNYISGNGAIERSFSELGTTQFTVDTATSVITSSGHGLVDGDRIRVSSDGVLPGSLSDKKAYYVVSSTPTTFKLSLTSGGTAIGIPTAGTGTHTWYLASKNTISDTIQALDITEYLDGIALVPAVFDSANDIAGMELILENDDTNYITLSSLTDSIGDNFIDGLNLVRFKLSERTETGTLDYTDITSWKLRVWTASGTSQTVIIDKISLQKTGQYYFEYYSNRVFIDGSTGAWKDTPVLGDIVNLNRDTRDILHYETVLLVAQGNTKVRQSRSGFDNFTAQLGRKYNQYWSRHPSSEAPLSYNNMHDDRLATLPEYIGANIQAQVGVDYDNLDLATSQFVDNETPDGTINGSNTVFTLSHEPNPANSLLLWLNGVYQTQGVDYTLSQKTITFTSAPDIAFAGTPFVAFYRYTV